MLAEGRTFKRKLKMERVNEKTEGRGVESANKQDESQALKRVISTLSPITFSYNRPHFLPLLLMLELLLSDLTR